MDCNSKLVVDGDDCLFNNTVDDAPPVGMLLTLDVLLILLLIPLINTVETLLLLLLTNLLCDSVRVVYCEVEMGLVGDCV